MILPTVNNIIADGRQKAQISSPMDSPKRQHQYSMIFKLSL